MFEIRNVSSDERQVIDRVVDIHLSTFQGFFLTFMGKGFLNQLYLSFCKHPESGLMIATENGCLVGFLAYSGNYSGFFRYLLRTRLVPFAWYSVGALFRKPKVFLHLIRAFMKPSETKRREKYVEISSIGVEPSNKGKGIGTLLVESLKQRVNFQTYEYISLETDALDNDPVINFYEKNGFVRERLYETTEGRKMFEYRFMRAK